MLSCNCAAIDLYHACPNFTFMQSVLSAYCGIHLSKYMIRFISTLAVCKTNSGYMGIVPTGGAFEVWTTMIQVHLYTDSYKLHAE